MGNSVLQRLRFKKLKYPWNRFNFKQYIHLENKYYSLIKYLEVIDNISTPKIELITTKFKELSQY